MSDLPPLEPQNLTRACHEALLLTALAGGPRHGYQLVLDIESRSAGRFRFNHGTLYPILHKLEKDGLIRGDWDSSGGGRKRKCYTLTDAGGAHAEELRARLADFVAHLGEALGGWPR